MNWNKPEGLEIKRNPNETPTQDRPILEQWTIANNCVLFFSWPEGHPQITDYTVALWMPKGLKKRNNVNQ